MLRHISNSEFFGAMLILTGFYYSYLLLLFRKEIVQLLRKSKIIETDAKDGP